MKRSNDFHRCGNWHSNCWLTRRSAPCFPSFTWSTTFVKRKHRSSSRMTLRLSNDMSRMLSEGKQSTDIPDKQPLTHSTRSSHPENIDQFSFHSRTFSPFPRKRQATESFSFRLRDQPIETMKQIFFPLHWATFFIIRKRSMGSFHIVRASNLLHKRSNSLFQKQGKWQAALLHIVLPSKQHPISFSMEKSFISKTFIRTIWQRDQRQFHKSTIFREKTTDSPIVYSVGIHFLKHVGRTSSSCFSATKLSLFYISKWHFYQIELSTNFEFRRRICPMTTTTRKSHTY